jgi:hypothetical protein
MTDHRDSLLETAPNGPDGWLTDRHIRLNFGHLRQAVGPVTLSVRVKDLLVGISSPARRLKVQAILDELCSAHGDLQRIERVPNLARRQAAADRIVKFSGQLFKEALGLAVRGRRPKTDQRLLRADHQSVKAFLLPVRRILQQTSSPKDRWSRILKEEPEAAKEILAAKLKDDWMTAAAQDLSAMAAQLLACDAEYQHLQWEHLERLTRAKRNVRPRVAPRRRKRP